MLDFEAALWQALAMEFVDAVVKGCTFHYAQAIWRKVQEMGLQTAYTQRRRVQSFIRLVMCWCIIQRRCKVCLVCSR